MTTYRYLGWGKTNSDGIAKLDHNSEGQEIEHSYTGTGAGEIDVLASLDNPIVEGSIVSETFEVIDCTVYDKGLSGEGQHNDIYYLSSGITGCLSRTSDGTLIDISNAGITSNQQCYINQTGAYNYNIIRGSIVEFDVVSVDNSDIRIQVSNIGTTTKYSSALLNEGSAPFHVKIMVEATETKIYFDDTLKITTTGCDGEKVSIMFLFYQNKGTSIKFKDMCIYPI